MIVLIVIRRDRERDRHEVFRDDTVTIGSAAGNDIVLVWSGIDRHHATLYFEEDGSFEFEEVNPAVEERREFARRRAPRVQTELDGSTIRIKPFTLAVETYVEALEIRMLEAVAAGDDDVRLVYADWLETRGDGRRAELLRAQLAIVALDHETEEFAHLAERIYALASRVPEGWASYVARPAIDVGDRALTFRVGPTRGARGIAGESYLVVQIWLAGVHLTTFDDVVFVGQFARDVDADLPPRLPPLPHPGESPEDNHRRCVAFGEEALRRYSWMAWGPTTDGLRVLAFRDGDDAVLTAETEARTSIVAARLPIATLERTLRGLLDVLRLA